MSLVFAFAVGAALGWYGRAMRARDQMCAERLRCFQLLQRQRAMLEESAIEANRRRVFLEGLDS